MYHAAFKKMKFAYLEDSYIISSVSCVLHNHCLYLTNDSMSIPSDVEIQYKISRTHKVIHRNSPGTPVGKAIHLEMG